MYLPHYGYYIIINIKKTRETVYTSVVKPKLSLCIYCKNRLADLILGLSVALCIFIAENKSKYM